MAAVMVFCCLASSCKKGDDEFPDIVYPDDTTESEISGTVETVDETDTIPEITVASPYSQETISLLSKLYYCKTHDIMGENTGDTISLDYLASIDPDYIINCVVTSGEGASADNIEQWSNSGADVPDIFLTCEFSQLKNDGLLAPLNSYTAGNDMMSPGRIFLNSLGEMNYGGTLYGVPFYSSVILLAGNPAYIPSSGKLAFKNDVAHFDEYLSNINAEYDCIPLASGYDLVPYMNSAFAGDRSCSFMMRSEYIRDSVATHQIITDNINHMTELYNERLTSNLTYEGTNPIFVRKAGLWLISSSDIDYFNQYYPSGMYFVALPCSSEQGQMSPMTRLYSLCVSNMSDNKDFAAEFAAFMALDTDARLLLETLEPHTGFLPCVKSQDVWNIVTSEPQFGQTASFFYQALDRAVYYPSSTDPLYVSVTEYFANYGGNGFDAGACYGQH